MGVMVIGMHRSGTSALTGALEAAGLFVGPPQALMPADIGNPDGHLELQDVGDLNEEILAHFGGSWDGPPSFPDGLLADPDADIFVQRARHLVESSLGDRPFVLKDPRLALLLPLWRRALLDRLCAIVIVREPNAVAWSLALRDGFSPLSSFALWSSYYRAAIEGLSGLQVHVCQYTELVEDPTSVLTAVTASLRDWGELPESFDLHSATARIRPGLQRDTWPRGQSEFEVPDEVSALQKHLTDLAGRHESFEAGTLPKRAYWEHDLLEERRIAGVRLRASSIEHLEELRAARERLTEAEHNHDQLLDQRRHLEFEARRHLELLKDIQGHLDRERNDAEELRTALMLIEQSSVMRHTYRFRRLYARLRARARL